jgi:predicted amidohydrolase YtcJ
MTKAILESPFIISYYRGGDYCKTGRRLIETGKLADFVILSRNPTQVPPDSIKAIFVEKTFIGGRPVFVR